MNGEGHTVDGLGGGVLRVLLICDFEGANSRDSCARCRIGENSALARLFFELDANLICGDGVFEFGSQASWQCRGRRAEARVAGQYWSCLGKGVRLRSSDLALHHPGFIRVWG